MEKIIAYKSLNGRLFETEEKCLAYEKKLSEYAYEKKLSEYPKVKESVVKAMPSYVVGGTYEDIDILRYTIETREKPHTKKKIERYYIVGGKYKFIDLFKQIDIFVMNGTLFKNGKVSMNWYLAFCHFAEQILLGNELTDDFVKEKIDAINEVNKIKLDVKVIEPNKKWEIDNPSWKSGITAPHTFTIEKI